VRERCSADCDASGVVDIIDLLMSVSIALGRTELAVCAAGDTDGSGGIEVAELVRAIGAALGTCGIVRSG
jgi:hypothetical protein